MALQLRRLLPHGYAHRAVTLATKPPTPAMVLIPSLIRLLRLIARPNYRNETSICNFYDQETTPPLFL